MTIEDKKTKFQSEVLESADLPLERQDLEAGDREAITMEMAGKSGDIESARGLMEILEQGFEQLQLILSEVI